MSSALSLCYVVRETAVRVRKVCTEVVQFLTLCVTQRMFFALATAFSFNTRVLTQTQCTLLPNAAVL